MKPLLTAAAATEVADDQLVAAVREGSEEAFEVLYRRYRPRIVAYVRGMVGDHARAEDIAQEAFMSALRGLRASSQEIAFRPWMYEIAKNACIDHLRRARRGTEVSIDSDDFSPQEEGRISQSVSGTDAEVARRKELESLQMAFGDLPESQHQILVMRELEGLSYDRIGSRMGLSRGAVESQLFRARRTLRDGFDEIDTGERCVRMRVTMEAAADGLRTGMRERRRLTIAPARLRRLPPHGGRRSASTTSRSRQPGTAGSALRRIAGFLPLPGFLRRRMEDGVAARSTRWARPRSTAPRWPERRPRSWSPRRSPPAEPAWRPRRPAAGCRSPAAREAGPGRLPSGSGHGDGAGAGAGGTGAGSTADGGGAAGAGEATTPAGAAAPASRPAGEAGGDAPQDAGAPGTPGRTGEDAAGSRGRRGRGRGWRRGARPRARSAARSARWSRVPARP